MDFLSQFPQVRASEDRFIGGPGLSAMEGQGVSISDTKGANR
jgi:hypothetical protein